MILFGRCPGGRFSKDPATYRARKAVLETIIRLLCCFFNIFQIKEGKITTKFQSLNRVLVEDTKRFLSPEKFRDVRETGP